MEEPSEFKRKKGMKRCRRCGWNLFIDTNKPGVLECDRCSEEIEVMKK